MKQKIQAKLRKISGGLIIAFIGFAVTGAVIISSLTGYSQYITIKNKIDGSLHAGQKAAVAHIRNNLNDGALAEKVISPATNDIIAEAREEAIDAALVHLGPHIRQSLAKRNGGNAREIFDVAATTVTINNGQVDVKMGVEAEIIAAVPIRYRNESETVSGTPASFNLRFRPSLRLTCPGAVDCGECGECDGATGQCIPKTTIPDGLGGFKIPDIDNSSSEEISCRAVDPFGEFCTSIGWNIIEENGIRGCELANCKLVPEHHGWHVNFAHTIKDGGANATSFFPPPPALASVSNLCIHGDDYTRSVQFPTNIVNPAAPAGVEYYAVCKTASHLSQASLLSKRIFVSSNHHTGRFGGGLAGADQECQNRANAAGLPGSYRAIMSNSVTTAKSRIDGNQSYRLVNGTRFNLCPLWPDISSTALFETAINVDEFGNTIPPPVVSLNFFGIEDHQQFTSTRVWSGTNYDGSNNNFLGFSGYTSPSAGIMRNCRDWTSDTFNFFEDSATYGLARGSDSTQNSLGVGWITGGSGGLSTRGCNDVKRIYCAEM